MQTVTNATTWPAAAGTTTDVYTVKVNGVDVPVMGAPMPENCIVEAQRHPYSFALFDADGEVTQIGAVRNGLLPM